MRQLSVVLPTWDMRRALTRINEMEGLATTSSCKYILVTPLAEVRSVEAGLRSWEGGPLFYIPTGKYLSPVEAMAEAGEVLLDEKELGSVFAFLHDDVIIEQRGWDQIIIDHFSSHPRCGLAGFGGGVGFADADIYKVPYDYRQLARIDFVSNMREADKHGRRVDTAMRVAALDGFALITSREFYERAGNHGKREVSPQGEPVTRHAWQHCLSDGIPYHMYDAWISCRAAELGYETWMLPIACHHQGGQTSVAREADYAGVVARLGYESPQALYDLAHRRIYDRFSGVLPIRIPKGE